MILFDSLKDSRGFYLAEIRKSMFTDRWRWNNVGTAQIERAVSRIWRSDQSRFDAFRRRRQ